MAHLSRIIASVQLTLLRMVAGHLTAGDRAYLARMLMQNRLDPGTRALAHLFNQGVLAFKNKQYDVDLNGEEALLARLKPFGPKLLLDVGANIGEWSLAAHRHLPQAQIHAFEIAPPTAKILESAIRAVDANVIVNAFGLGAAEGAITLYCTPDHTVFASTIRRAVEITIEELGNSSIYEVTARITTGDAYLTEHDIAHVDVLKVDVEGAEAAVFTGFSKSFEAGSIDIVQFEYGSLNLATRYLLADAAQFFTTHGFILGKLYPEGVAFKDFEATDEDFVGPNYVACRADRTDLIAALRCDVPRLT